MSNRKYIGVDLGTWYNTTNKTSIAVGYEKDNKLYIEGIYKEYTKQNSDICSIYTENELLKILEKHQKQVLNDTNWNVYLSIDDKNSNLIRFLEREAENNALIGIDAPFGIPSCLCHKNKSQTIYIPENKDINLPNELSNPYIFDNSSRFVYEYTNQIALAPAGDKIGKMTARMIHLCQNFETILNIKKVPSDLYKNTIMTFEVFPTATLYLYIKYLFKDNIEALEKYLTRSKSEDKYKEKKPEDYKKLISYKNDNWKDNRDRMLELLKDDIIIDKSIIKTDDDYDAVICTLTTYLVDKYGYIKPTNENLFQDSFIYLPDIKQENRLKDTFPYKNIVINPSAYPLTANRTQKRSNTTKRMNK